MVVSFFAGANSSSPELKTLPPPRHSRLDANQGINADTQQRYEYGEDLLWPSQETGGRIGNYSGRRIRTVAAVLRREMTRHRP
jgi:hypothetical protein